MKHVSALRAGADPFDERTTPKWRERLRLLGGSFEFSSNDRRLIELVRTAYANLPAHRLANSRPRFEIRLRCVPSTSRMRRPPPLQLSSNGRTYCGIMDATSFAILSPGERSAFVSISSALLEHRYHARYELLEFAVYALAARSLGLVSMHAACVGRDGRGVLLIGPSGAGKSTLALQCLSLGMRLLSEDSVFVSPADLSVAGIGTFLHLRTDSTIRPRGERFAKMFSTASVIRRRSGIEKLELDLRSVRNLISPSPLRLASIVFVSEEPASGSEPPIPIDKRELRRRLTTTQSYAAAQPNWMEFWRQAREVPAFVIRRSRDPIVAARHIEAMLT